MVEFKRRCFLALPPVPSSYVYRALRTRFVSNARHKAASTSASAWSLPTSATAAGSGGGAGGGAAAATPVAVALKEGFCVVEVEVGVEVD